MGFFSLSFSIQSVVTFARYLDKFNKHLMEKSRFNSERKNK